MFSRSRLGQYNMYSKIPGGYNTTKTLSLTVWRSYKVKKADLHSVVPSYFFICLSSFIPFMKYMYIVGDSELI